MKFKSLLFTLLSVAIIFSSCSDSQMSADNSLKSIPKDVSMVTAIDINTILEKADFENVKQMAFYQELINETKGYNSTLGDALADPQSSGIDLSKNIYIAHQLDVDNPEDVYVGIVATVKDKSALEKLINSDTKFKLSKHDNFDLAMFKSQSVAWNGSMVVLGMTNSFSDPVAKIEKFFTTTEETSIASDDNLKKAFSGNHDITSWMSSNALASSESLKNALIMGGIDPKAAEDNFIHSYVDFNDGAIESRSDMYMQAALMEDINLLFKDKVSTDFSSYIPSTVNSAMSVSLDFEGVATVLQKKGVMMMADFALQEYGLTTNDIASTFGGDILLYSIPGSGETPIGTFATSIINNENLNKFITLATEHNALEKISDNLYSIPGTGIITGGFNTPDAQLLIQDNMIVVSGDAAHLAKIASGGFSGNDKVDKSKIKSLKNNIFAGFMDFNGLMENFGNKKNDLQTKIEEFNFTTTRKKGTFNANFKEKNSNGLKQLFEAINEIYLADQKGEI